MAAATLFHSSNSLFVLCFSPPPPPPPTSANNISSFPLYPRRPSGTLSRNPGRCLAAKSGPPLPPPESDQTQLTGSLSKFQDKVQIFFAVLFWMSLFYWASVWDDRDRLNKGSRFRR